MKAVNASVSRADPARRAPWRRRLQRLRASVYFATVPWCNYGINAFWHHRFTRGYIPKSVYLEVTNRCNARCVMCPHEKMQRPRGHMPWEVFQRIVEECASFEGRGLSLFLHKDGEPLMDPQLFERIAYARQRLPRSRLHFNTNAALLDAAKAEALLQSPLDSVVFSVDGASTETYEAIRVGLSYAQVTANIQAFFRLKRERGSRLHVTLQMVVNPSNRHEVARYREEWGGLADRVVFKPMHNFLVQGTSVHGAGLNARQVSRCKMPFKEMFIYWNGDVALCCWDYDHLAPAGTVMTQPLLAIYNGPRFEAVRRGMRQMDCRRLHPCAVCSQIYGQDNPLLADEALLQEGT